MKQKLFVALAVSFILVAIPVTAFAHGARITYQTRTAIEITAAYDTGEPMEGAQVTIYAPDDPSTPCFTGVCDENGRFTFTPDLSKPGTWDVQVRHAGHGGIIHIPVGEETAAQGGTCYTPLQIVLMAACVVWGLVGTALFFARRKA
ncbi:MAG: hypothetical protein XD69_0653 [Clostridia bacterium 62_21]|nr:MAG: hypothetical protein XD69_0653 [Clostridia bacterium 62_21]